MRCSARCSSARPAPAGRSLKTSMIHGPPNGGGASVMRGDQDRGDHLAVGDRQAARRQQPAELAGHDPSRCRAGLGGLQPVRMAGRERGEVDGEQLARRAVDRRELVARRRSRAAPRGRACRRANGGAGARRRPRPAPGRDPPDRRSACPRSSRSHVRAAHARPGPRARAGRRSRGRRARRARSARSAARSRRSACGVPGDRYLRRWAHEAFSPPGAFVDWRSHDAPRAARGRPRRGRHGPDLRQPARRSRHPVLLRAGLHPRRPRFRPGRGRARGRRAGRPAAVGSRRARGRGRPMSARRCRSPQRASTAIRRRRCGSPGSPAPTARPRRRSSRGRCWRARACAAVCSGRSSRSWAGRTARSCGRRPRRSTSSARSARCSTRATSRARWRSPRTRWSSSGRPACTSPRPCSPT